MLPRLVELARKHGVKIVATNDVHYLNKHDATAQKVLQCISFRTTMSPTEMDEGTADLPPMADGVDDTGYFPTKEFYLKSGDEMSALFPNLGDALANTLEVANKCEPYFFR